MLVAEKCCRIYINDFDVERDELIRAPLLPDFAEHIKLAMMVDAVTCNYHGSVHM